MAAIAIFEDYQTNQLVKKVVKEMEVVTDIELSSMEDGKVYALENRMDYEYTVGIKYGGKLYLMQMDEYMGKRLGVRKYMVLRFFRFCRIVGKYGKQRREAGDSCKEMVSRMG